MKVTHIPFQKTGFFSKIMADYLEKDDKINSFYHNFPDVEGFKNQLEEKGKSFPLVNRKILVEALSTQYLNFDVSEETQQNITSLREENTYTITTGHQLNLFTGPLYFLYKIISVINLCEKLSKKFPENNFVPVYWMATEDHDFDEINYFNFKGKKVQWNRNDGGAVGRFSTDGLESVFEEFSKHLGDTKNAIYLKQLFSDGYLKHNNLADATRYIANTLFGTYGLIILDGDDKKLKKIFAPFVQDELENKTSFESVSNTITDLEKNYKVQVNPREINLFYLGQNSRERIIKENENRFVLNETEIVFTKDEILKELEESPDNFSPNVIMRPLYQEVILPNLSYTGGGGELAYWMELKAYFEKVKIPFPILLLRNSVQVISEKQQRKLDKLDISIEELFLKQHVLLPKKVVENSNISINFEEKRAFLQQHFNQLKEVAAKTDQSFIGAVKAQEVKQIKGLDNLEKRLLRAEKRKHKGLVDRITELQNQLLPNQSLEERQRNFSEFYLEYGQSFIDDLKNALVPLQLEFTILEI
jgi:bacillithiol biosynthesis cysteine-adding enzyme BshC